MPFEAVAIIGCYDLEPPSKGDRRLLASGLDWSSDVLEPVASLVCGLQK